MEPALDLPPQLTPELAVEPALKLAAELVLELAPEQVHRMDYLDRLADA